MPKVLVPLAEGCEELEAVSIIDILRRGGIEVVSASLQPGPIRASRGTRLVADTTLDEAMEDSYDMVALPGGLPGAEHLANDARVQSLLQSMAQRGAYTCAVCAAPKALATAGLLHGKRATSYPGVLNNGQWPQIEYTGAAIERDGRVITSRGPGTAMDFALELVETLAGRATRDEVEQRLVR